MKFQFLVTLSILLTLMPQSTAFSYIEDEILEEDQDRVEQRVEFLENALSDSEYLLVESQVKEVRDVYTIELDLEPGTYHAWTFGGYEIIDLGIFAYDENFEEIAGDNNAKPEFEYDIYDELYGRDDDIPEIHFTLAFPETVQIEIEVFEFFRDRYERYQYSGYDDPDPYEEFYERGYIGFVLAKDGIE